MTRRPPAIRLIGVALCCSAGMLLPTACGNDGKNETSTPSPASSTSQLPLTTSTTEPPPTSDKTPASGIGGTG